MRRPQQRSIIRGKSSVVCERASTGTSGRAPGLVPGAQGGGLVGDDAVDAGLGEAAPVVGGVRGPGPEAEVVAAGCFDGVGRDDAMEERDGADAVLGGAGAERRQPGAADGRDDGGGIDLGSKGAGALHEIVIEGVEGGPALGPVAADDGEGRVEEGCAVLTVVGRDLQLTHDRDAAGDEVEYLVEGGHVLALSGVGPGELREGGIADGAGQVGSAIEGVVVEEDRNAVGAEVEVDLHGGGAGEGGAHAGERVRGGLAGGGSVRDHDRCAHGASEDNAHPCDTLRVPEACVFCAIVAGEAPASVVWEDALAMAFMDLRQENPGHVLVIPRTHIADILDLDDCTGAALMGGTTRVARAVDRALAPDGINVWQSTGEAAGQEVFHLHLHVMPRRFGDRLFRPYPELPPTTPRNTLEALAAEVRDRLAEGA